MRLGWMQGKHLSCENSNDRVPVWNFLYITSITQRGLLITWMSTSMECSYWLFENIPLEFTGTGSKLPFLLQHWSLTEGFFSVLTNTKGSCAGLTELIQYLLLFSPSCFWICRNRGLYRKTTKHSIEPHRETTRATMKKKISHGTNLSGLESTSSDTGSAISTFMICLSYFGGKLEVTSGVHLQLLRRDAQNALGQKENRVFFMWLMDFQTVISFPK